MQIISHETRGDWAQQVSNTVVIPFFHIHNFFSSLINFVICLQSMLNTLTSASWETWFSICGTAEGMYLSEVSYLEIQG